LPPSKKKVSDHVRNSRKQYISKRTHKYIALRFWIEYDVMISYMIYNSKVLNL